jgi:hypothetical protein
VPARINKRKEPVRLFRDGQRFDSGVASVRVVNGTFALTIGDVAVVLNRRRAQDVVGALTYALLATVPVEPERPAKKTRRRTPKR